MTTLAEVATLFLRDVGAPVTPANLDAVEVWIRHENSNPTLRNNPLNLHSSGGLVGQVGSANVGSGDRNVAVFDTIEHGVAADASNLVRLPYYTKAVAALRAGNGAGFLSEIAASPWSAGHYRIGGVAGTNSLLRDYNGTGQAGAGVSYQSGSVAHLAASTPSAAAILAQLKALQTPSSATVPTTTKAAAVGVGAIVALALVI